MNNNQVIEGITVIMTPMGDIKITIHKDDLVKSLANCSTLNNGTTVAVACKRLIPSRKGHTHNKPRVLQACINPEKSTT